MLRCTWPRGLCVCNNRGDGVCAGLLPTVGRKWLALFVSLCGDGRDLLGRGAGYLRPHHVDGSHFEGLTGRIEDQSDVPVAKNCANGGIRRILSPSPRLLMTTCY